jgi:hypothetical protein
MRPQSLVILLLVSCCSGTATWAEDLHPSDLSNSIYCFIGNRFGAQPGTLERGWVCIPEYRKPAVLTETLRREVTAQAAPEDLVSR